MACLNPLIEYINQITTLYNNASSGTYLNLYDAFEKSEFYQLTGEVCCPDCSNMYALSLSEPAISPLFTTIKDLSPVFDDCVFNYDLNIENSDVTIDATITNKNRTCCNSFSDCTTEFLNLLQELKYTPSDIAASTYLGEYGTINGDSSLCLLLDKLKSIPEEDALQILDVLIQRGISIYCYEGVVYAGSIDDFITFITANPPV